MDERDDGTGTAGGATAESTGGRAAGASGGQGGGEVRRRLDRPPGERYRGAAATGGSAGAEPGRPARRARRRAFAVGVTLVAAIAIFALVTFDIGPGIIVLGIVGGWLVGVALTGGARPGTGEDAGSGRALAAGLLAGAAPVLGLLLDSLRAYALGGVLLPWEYALARFGLAVPLAIAAAAAAGALRGR